MGIWRFAGAFAVAQRQSECGRKNPLNARQSANDHRRVLAGRDFVLFIESSVRPSKKVCQTENQNFFVLIFFSCIFFLFYSVF